MTCNGACNHTWDIIGIVQQEYRISYLTACEMLAYVLNITILQPVKNGHDDYVSNLERNLQILSDLSKYTTTCRVLTHGYAKHSPLDILKCLTEYAIELHQNKQDLRDAKGYPIFFISIRELLRLLNSSDSASGKHSAKITLLCYLGLLERITDHDLSPEALKRAQSPENDYRGKNPDRYKNSQGNRISFYRIPILTSEMLNHIENCNAVNWSRWYSISNISYNKICSQEGKRMADRIYAGRKIRHKST